MPAIRIRLLIGLLFCGAPLAGCTTTEMQNSGVEPIASFSGEAQLQLPDMVSVLPTSYAATEAGDSAYQVASLASGETTDIAAEPAQPAAFVGMPQPTAGPDGLPSLVDRPGATEQLPPPTVSRSSVDTLIAKYAALYDVPEGLVRRVVKRESNFSPTAYNRGNWGLMQIKHATARGMGYDGPAKGLLDAETNLKFAVKYLRGAYLVARGDHNRADRLYQSGYYYDAKRMGLLDETGLGKDRVRKRAGAPAA